MKWLYVPDMDSAEEDQKEVKLISDLVHKFVEEHPELQEMIRDSDDEEVEGAKPSAIFSILIDFLTWLGDKNEKHETDFSINGIHPSNG